MNGSVRLLVTPFWLCSHHCIFMKFPGVITRRWQKWRPCKRSRSEVKVTEVNAQLSRFRTVTRVWIHIWWWNDAHSFMLLRKGVLLFSRSSVKFLGHTAKTIVDFDPNCFFFPDCNSSLNSPMAKMMHKAWYGIEEAPNCFQRSFIKFQAHTGQKKCQFWPKLSVSGLYLQFEFTDGFKIIHKAWCSIEAVPYYFWRHPSNFKVTRAENLRIWIKFQQDC